MSSLLNYLPAWYRESPEVRAIQQAIQPELDTLWTFREEFARQLDPSTATWGLSLWEEALGLEAEEDDAPSGPSYLTIPSNMDADLFDLFDELFAYDISTYA